MGFFAAGLRRMFIMPIYFEDLPHSNRIGIIAKLTTEPPFLHRASVCAGAPWNAFLETLL